MWCALSLSTCITSRGIEEVLNLFGRANLTLGGNPWYRASLEFAGTYPDRETLNKQTNKQNLNVLPCCLSHTSYWILVSGSVIYTSLSSHLSLVDFPFFSIKYPLNFYTKDITDDKLLPACTVLSKHRRLMF